MLISVSYSTILIVVDPQLFQLLLEFINNNSNDLFVLAFEFNYSFCTKLIDFI